MACNGTEQWGVVCVRASSEPHQPEVGGVQDAVDGVDHRVQGANQTCWCTLRCCQLCRKAGLDFGGGGCDGGLNKNR